MCAIFGLIDYNHTLNANRTSGIMFKLNSPDEKNSEMHTAERVYSLQSRFARTAADSSAQRSGIPQTATVALFGSQKDKAMALYIRTLKKQPAVLSEWNDTLWTLMVEESIVHRNGEITFMFYNGTEVRVGE